MKESNKQRRSKSNQKVLKRGNRRKRLRICKRKRWSWSFRIPYSVCFQKTRALRLSSEAARVPTAISSTFSSWGTSHRSNDHQSIIISILLALEISKKNIWFIKNIKQLGMSCLYEKVETSNRWLSSQRRVTI